MSKSTVEWSIPWLALDLDFPAEAMLREAQALADKFVVHRSSNGRGWKSLCIHGLGSAKTQDATQYGFASEADAIHDWTDIAENCPATVAFIKELPAERLYRVRFMLLEPGGYILPHRDTPKPGLGPINVSLNHPAGCLFKFEGAGIVPFEAGRAIMLDVSVRHSVINLSDRPRYHIIVHGSFSLKNPLWVDLVDRSRRASLTRIRGNSGLTSEPTS
jgi:Aspartyl/Asparaginyl beta-hydroxylase